MKRSLTVAVLALAFLLMAAMRTDDRVPMGVRISIAPSTEAEYQLLGRATPDTYTCRARIYDATSESYGFAGADVVVAPGTKETKTVTTQGLAVTLTVAISKENHRAQARVMAKRGDRIVIDQRSEVELRAPGRAIMPLQ